MSLQDFVFIGNASTEASLPLFNLDSRAFILMIPNIISFVILAFVFSQFLYKPIRDYVKKRMRRITAEINETTEINAIVDEFKATYEQRVRDIDAERNAIFDETRKEATVRSNQILDDAKADVIALQINAKHNIATELESVKWELHQAIIDISIHMAEKVVNERIYREDHEELFAEVMVKLENTVLRAYL